MDVKAVTDEVKKESRNDARYFRSAVAERCRGFCEACGDPHPFTMELHHIVPVSKGGTGYPENLAALCPNCHAIVEKASTSIADIPAFDHWVFDYCGEEAYKTIIAISCQEWSPE